MTHPHLSDEQLSSHVDGRDDQATADHLPGCGACLERAGQLRAAAAWVGEAPEAPRFTEQAVAAATAVGGAAHPWRDRSAPSWRGPVVVLAVAAAIVVVLAAVPLLTRTRRTTTAADRSTSAAVDSAAPAISGGDLGDQSEETALRDTVRASLSGPRPEAAAPQSASAAPSAASPCLDAARRLLGTRPVLQYTATIRWRGTPGTVLVFSAVTSAGGTLSHQLLVLAQSGCAVLVSQRF